MTWRRKAPSASPRSKRRRKRSCRSPASSPRPAPSRSAARARNMSDPRLGPAVATIERWRLPEVEGPIVGRSHEDRRAAASEESVRLALKEAEARGYEAGLARARAETGTQLAALAERVKRLDAALNILARPLEQLDAEIESELAQL